MIAGIGEPIYPPLFSLPFPTCPLSLIRCVVALAADTAPSGRVGRRLTDRHTDLVRKDAGGAVEA